MKPYLTLHHPANASRYYKEGCWQDETFYDLLKRNARRHPDAPALRDGTTSLSWSQTLARTDALACEFTAAGVHAGERVSIWMSNRVDAVIAFLACSRAGLACNPSLHRTFTCAEVIMLLTRLEASVLITESSWGADRDEVDFEALLKPLSFLKNAYTAGKLPTEIDRYAAPISDPDAVAYLAFTSGTTGDPKCVMHSSNTLLANARDLVADWALSGDAKLLSLSPLSHHIAWVGVAQWLLAGCEFITDDPPESLSRLDWILETRATYVMGVPTHAMDILDAQRRAKINALGNVEVFYMAGSPIPPVVAEAMAEQGIKPQNVYGMTENSSHQYTHRNDDLATWTTTCGRGGKAYTVCIVDPNDPDRELKQGETGQIAGRGAALMLGYLDNQRATERSFTRDGWFLSGDLGSLDERGNLTVDGRLKDLIIRGGRNIYPAHIEALAHRHECVHKAAAFPVTDERLGERVCLAILGTLDASQTLDHLAALGLSIYDMPEYFLPVDTFPLTASGKILKRELIEMVKRGELVPVPVRYKANGKATGR